MAAPLPRGLPARLLLLAGLLLRTALYPLRRLTALAFPPGEHDGLASSAVSDRSARLFAAYFRRTCLEGGGGAASASASSAADALPSPFGDAGYRSVLADLSGRPSPPLLLVYLDSPLHPDCRAFGAGTLAAGGVLRYLRDEGASTVTCLGASVHSSDGAHLASLLGATAYPFVALLHVRGGGGGGGSGSGSGSAGAPPRDPTLELRLKLQGRPLREMRPAQFLAHLQAVVGQHAVVLAEAEARRLQREEEALLRDEQDREYREGLDADRAAQAEREARREAEEAERREAEEAERREREEREGRLERARAVLEGEGAEPPAEGDPAASARVRLTLPNGKRVDRRFHADAPIAAVRAFLTVHFHEAGVGIDNFTLSSSYPRRAFEDPAVTLREGGLVPQAVLMVQDLDA